MSWDIIIFNSKQIIISADEIDEEKLVPIDFDEILENSFDNIIKDGNHREIKGKDFSIDYFTNGEPSSNMMLSIYGENGLYVLVDLAKKYGWQIFDTGLGDLIDLINPENNGYENYKRYIEQILKDKSSN